MRNVILVGAGCSRELAEYLCTLGVPVLTSWQGIDLVPEEIPVFCGRPGVVGQRAANIIIQKAEALHVFGARLDPSTVNYSYDTFAPKAKKFIHDVDDAELDKYPKSWIVRKTDLRRKFEYVFGVADTDWLLWCKALYNRFRHELDGDQNTDYVDPYLFVRYLSDACQEDEIIVPASSGMQSCAMMQAFKVKSGQRIMLCNTIGAMGFEPMAIGAAIASGRRVIVVSGDGGFGMNMQELEVVNRLGLNIKYFVFENGGYGSITTMQDNRFNGKRVASDKESGFTTPNLYYTALTFRILYSEINSNQKIQQAIDIALRARFPTLTRVRSSLEFKYACKVEASLKDNRFINDDLSDMTPKVDDYERIMNE